MNPEDYKIIIKDDTSLIKEGNIEKWYDAKTNDLRKNIEYWSNGNKYFEVYYLNGKRHREDGPAYQSWYQNGNKYFEAYYLNGKYHREDGPAKLRWYKDGNKYFEEYWLDNKVYSKEEYKAIILAKKFELI
jgi:hypothetical protein